MSGPDAMFMHTGSVAAEHARRGNAYLEFLRVASMSAGVYVLRAGSVRRAVASPAGRALLRTARQGTDARGRWRIGKSRPA